MTFASMSRIRIRIRVKVRRKIGGRDFAKRNRLNFLSGDIFRTFEAVQPL